MRGQAGTPAITWPVIDTGNLGGCARCQHRAALPNAAAADVASQEHPESYGPGSRSRDSSRSFTGKSAAAFLFFLFFAIFGTSDVQRIQVW